MLNPLDLKGRRILVTGASSGIGRASAQLLSQLGARLTLVGRDLERLRETLSLLDGADHTLEARDLSQADGIPEWIRRRRLKRRPVFRACA